MRISVPAFWLPMAIWRPEIPPPELDIISKYNEGIQKFYEDAKLCMQIEGMYKAT